MEIQKPSLRKCEGARKEACEVEGKLKGCCTTEVQWRKRKWSSWWNASDGQERWNQRLSFEFIHREVIEDLFCWNGGAKDCLGWVHRKMG